jgi:hypothetical protein
LRKFFESLFVALAALLLAACSHHSGSSTPSVANVRVVNAAGNSALTVNFNGITEFSSVPASSASDYNTFNTGVYTVTMTGSAGTLAAPAFNISLSASQNYTLFAYVRDGALVASLLNENQPIPGSGTSTIGVSNISPDAGSLDVYVVAPGTTNVAGLAPTFTSSAYRAAPSWATLVAGTFDVIATAAGNQNDVRLHLPSVQLAAGQILLLAFTSTSGGALVNAALLDQVGAVQFVPTTQARVRVVSALPVGGATPVIGSVGSGTFAPVFAPNPGAYTLVPGGSTSYAISVAGSPIATLPAAAFATGGDYTLLVYGSVSSPSVTVLTDVNQLPSVAGDVSLRLINAGVTAAAGLTLYDNNVQVASNIPYGTASAYVGVPSASAVLELVVPSVPPVLTTQLLAPAGAVYSVLVIDTTLTPVVIRDR